MLVPSLMIEPGGIVRQPPPFAEITEIPDELQGLRVIDKSRPSFHVTWKTFLERW